MQHALHMFETVSDAVSEAVSLPTVGSDSLWFTGARAGMNMSTCVYSLRMYIYIYIHIHIHIYICICGYLCMPNSHGLRCEGLGLEFQS